MTYQGTHNEYPSTAAHAAVYHAGETSDADTVTINGVVFEFDADGSSAGITAGNIWVDNAGDAGVEATAFAAAINAATNALVAGLITAVADTVNDVVWLYADTPGTAGNAYTLATTNAGNLTISNATFVDGQARGTEGTYVFRHTVTAAETAAAGTFIQFYTPMAAVLEVSIIHEAVGIIDATSDAAVAVSGGTVTLTEGASPAWTDADVLVVTIKGIDFAEPVS